MIKSRFNEKYFYGLVRNWGNSGKVNDGLKIYHHLFFLIILFFTQTLYATNLVGHVYALDENGFKVPLAGANVLCANNKTIAKSDVKGKFELNVQNPVELTLIATFTGYHSDTILVNNPQDELLEFVLKQGQNLQHVTVTASRQNPILSKFSVLKTETIDKTGLVKLACCNLTESFENSATVTVGFADAISGAKQVQLLGLSGIYTQLQNENIPTLRGLASTYGWSYIPGSWLESIQISKGASSVVNGYESVAGQINLEYKKPNNTEPLFINVYSNKFGCYEGNVTAARQVAPNLWTGLLVSGTLDKNAHDYNGDGFLDMPQTELINVYNRWFYLNPNGVQSRTGIKFLYEDRKGGHDSKHLSNNALGAHYATNIENKDFTIENKTGFPIGDKEGQSIGIVNRFTHYEQNSAFGKKAFDGTQNSYFSNILFSSKIGENAFSKYTVGGSFVYDDFKTQYQDLLPFNLIPRTTLDRTEIVPGVFGEYTYSPHEKFTLIVGARTDYNSKYGWLFTPRANAKYNISDNLILRGSIGKGYRTPNVISDNIGVMASSRKLYLDGISNLNIESAWNYGGNLTFYIPIWDKRKITLSLDYFHTEFQNQAVVDIERNSNSVYFYNLKGRSFSDVLQADLSFTPFTGFDVFAAFRYNNTQITYSDGTEQFLVEKPLTSRYRGLVNLAYATKFKKWVFDFTTQLNGPSRIPWLNGYNSELKESQVFPIFLAQITKNTKHFDVYMGVENMFDFKQSNPIINPTNPFDQGFESSFIWGPIVGRNIYIGARIRFGKSR
jgi:outer membrane receptor for ferrienterochelin and colicins